MKAAPAAYQPGLVQEIISSVVTAASLVVVVLAELGHGEWKWLLTADLAACIYFWAEFALGLLRSADRPGFIRAQAVPMLGAVPVVIHLRWLRILRLLRLLRFIRLGAGLFRIWRMWGAALVENPLQALGIAAFTVMVLGSACLYAAEHPSNPTVKTFGDAVWLCATSMTTVGYGDIYPATAEGRIVSFTVMLLGVGILSSFAAAIVAAVLNSAQVGDPAEGKLAKRLERIEELLHSIGADRDE
jgi:voltage-gated potassium channel